MTKDHRTVTGVSRAKNRCMGMLCFGALVLARLIIVLIPFKRIVRLLAGERAESASVLPDVDEKRATWIGERLYRVSRRMLWRVRCYDLALAGLLLLRLWRLPGTVYFGIHRDDVGTIKAHAWLRAGRVIVTGVDNMELYTAVYYGSI